MGFVLQMADWNKAEPSFWYYCREGWSLNGDCCRVFEKSDAEEVGGIRSQAIGERGGSLYFYEVPRVSKLVSGELDCFEELERRGLA